MPHGCGVYTAATRAGGHLSPCVCGPGCNAVVTRSGGGSCGMVPYSAALPLRCTWSIDLADIEKPAAKAHMLRLLAGHQSDG